MTEKLDSGIPMTNRKYWRLALLAIPLFCAFCYFASPTDESYYKKLDKQAPHPTEIYTSQSRMLINGLSSHTFDLTWVDENTLSVFDDKSKEDLTINIKTGEAVREKRTNNNDEETYVSLFEPNGKDKIVATCPKENLVIHGGSIQWGKYEIALWEHEQLIATFPFTSEEWGDREKAPDSYSGFSPNCQYFYLVLNGDIDVEAYAAEELFLLDVQNRSFKLLLTGGRYPDWGDSPVQSVGPSWSPDEQEFVFGDPAFGLEIYNMISGKRRFIAGPSLKPFRPEWSPSGKWIAVVSFREAEKDEALIAVSPDGKQMAISTPCWLIDEYTWSPNGKQLAYLCTESISHEGSLWLWEINQ